MSVERFQTKVQLLVPAVQVLQVLLEDWRSAPAGDWESPVMIAEVRPERLSLTVARTKT